MAIASCEVKVISRGKGKSAVAAAAYRSGEKLSHEREGKTYEYSHKRNIAHTEILAPANAPEWAKDRSQLWNEVERTETRCNSRTAREIRIALPKELTLKQNIEAVRDYCHSFVKQGMIVDFALHNEKGNPHAHIMLTTRAITPEGFGEKVRAWDKKERVPEWRKEYETVTNKHLEMAGRPECINADSYEKQGIEKIPTIHLGHSSHAKEQRGERTIRGDRNRAIEEKNRQLATLDKIRKEVDLDIKYLQAEKRHEKPRTPTPERVEPPPTHHNHHTTYKRHTPEELDRLYKEAEQRYTNKPKEHHERRRRERQREDERGLEH